VPAAAGVLADAGSAAPRALKLLLYLLSVLEDWLLLYLLSVLEVL